MTEKEHRLEDAPEEEPQVYTVEKDMNGWQFSRRAFLTAAGAGAAVAAIGTVASCGESQPEEVVTRIVVKEVTVSSDSAPEATEAPVSTDVPTATDTAVPADTAAPTDTATPTETPTPTNTATPSKTPTPTNTPTDTATPTPAVPKAQFIKDITIPDGTVMKPAQPFTKTWRFKNVGAVPWGEGVQLAFVPGEHKGFESKKMAAPDFVDVPNVAPGKTVDISADLVAPQKLGQHRSYWRLRLGNGEWLENNHYADIFVASPQPIAESIDPGKEGVEFKVKKEGKWVTWTQPCGMPIPPGAVCVCNCVAAPPPGNEGAVPPGQEGGTISGPGGETRWLPCNSPIPSGWTCTCNCVSQCSCHAHKESCTCDAVHYWYPN